MGALVAEPQENMFSKKIFWFGSALLLIGVQAQSHQMGAHAQAAECCQEKTVGGVSYSLLPEAFHGSLPHQCLTSCVYTKTGVLSSPKFCFARGDLATECRDPVTVHVIVKSATTGYAVANASVIFFLCIFFSNGLGQLVRISHWFGLFVLHQLHQWGRDSQLLGQPCFSW